jgi:hypothetical protein
MYEFLERLIKDRVAAYPRLPLVSRTAAFDWEWQLHTPVWPIRPILPEIEIDKIKRPSVSTCAS